ncbi:hypothetical protein XU18_0035 [Perkinsela sp. CCAP 1560/4]|nr:hypothetical protein XU18_0035 [Perkinsela sp. CCAP 1560/4]|eukprot:KNH09350.1 hypothetical protein XU18_0035 [Perkinsela sp. CCAP 1560/4]
MARIRHHLEFIAFSSIIPASTILLIFSSWKAMLWFYGGKEEFMRLVFREPLQKEWFMVNPKDVFFRPAPLSNIPHKMPEEIKLYESAQEHPHSKNW